MNTNIYGDYQICVSVPLKSTRRADMARRVRKASWANDLVTYLGARATLELSIADF